jgi:hypothetical protein
MDEGNLRTRAYVAFGAAAVAIILAIFIISALVGSSESEEMSTAPAPAETVE